MSIHDYIFDNAAGATIRSDFNLAMLAIVSNNSYATEPTVKYAYMWWYDTTLNILKMRNAANDAWIIIGTFDQTNDVFRPVVSDFIDTTSVKTANYTVLTSDISNHIILGATNVADRVFTLPSVGSGDDGFVVHFYNASIYKLTLQPSDTDSIWNSGNGYGIETSRQGAYCSLRYDHTTTKWIPLQIGGGLWTIEGLKLWVNGKTMTTRSASATANSQSITDLANRHKVLAKSDSDIVEDDTYITVYQLDASGQEMQISHHVDWDIMEDDTDDFTILAKVMFERTPDPANDIMGQRESGTDEWFLQRGVSGNFEFNYDTSLGASLIISGGTLSADIWYDLVVARVGTGVGIYIDGTQVGFDDTWTEDTFVSGDLYIGSRGATVWTEGWFADVFIAYQNIFNAAPNVGNSDTITIPKHINLSVGNI